ncbi:trehalose/maltose transport system substrate-binding protein [Paracoccus sp. J56]|nr:trehalose/maltose transport system substrate-binding protein [Paracoccus sp. J56]
MEKARRSDLRHVVLAALMGSIAMPAVADGLFYVAGGVDKQARHFKELVKLWKSVPVCRRGPCR